MVPLTAIHAVLWLLPTALGAMTTLTLLVVLPRAALNWAALAPTVRL